MSNRKALAAAASAGAVPTVAAATTAIAALPALDRGAVVVEFEYLNETQGAHRLQEVDGEAPLVNDEDGAKVGALYLRKAAFGDAKPGERFRVTIEKVS